MNRKRRNELNALGIILIGFFIFKYWKIMIIVIPILLALIIFAKSPKGKGILGEFAVSRKLGKTNPNKHWYKINNITFFDGQKSVQIDHVLINESGIHVIETKNYAGRIYGDAKSKTWKQVLAFGKVKHDLYNPIWQNYGHIKGLNEVLKLEENYYFNYVVFTSRAELFVKQSKEVIYVNKIKKAIKLKNPILDQAEVIRIYNEILLLKQNNTITNKEHIKSVKERISQNNE